MDPTLLATQPAARLPTAYPEVTFACLKYLWSAGYRKQAVQRLLQLIHCDTLADVTNDTNDASGVAAAWVRSPASRMLLPDREVSPMAAAGVSVADAIPSTSTSSSSSSSSSSTSSHLNAAASAAAAAAAATFIPRGGAAAATRGNSDRGELAKLKSLCYLKLGHWFLVRVAANG
jgi:hypothetical protein